MSDLFHGGPGPSHAVCAWAEKEGWDQYFQWDVGVERYLRIASPMLGNGGEFDPALHYVPAEDGNASLAESVALDDLGDVKSATIQYDNGYVLMVTRHETGQWDWVLFAQDEEALRQVADGDFKVNPESEASKRHGEGFAAVHRAMTAAASWFTRTEGADPLS